MTFDAQYDNSEAQTCMTLAAIAYSSENVPADIQATIIANLQQFLSDWQLVWGPGLTSDNQNMIYVAQNTTSPQQFAVAIRGTDICFLSNLQQDAGVNTQVPLPFGPQNQGILIDSGSLGGLNDITQVTAQPVVGGVSTGTAVTVGQFLQTQLANVTSGSTLDVFVTGHSLGGCLASVTMPWLAETSSNWTNASALNVKAYTFAAPTAGNAAFASWVDSLPAPYFMWRVVNPNDLAPRAWADLEDVIPQNLVVEVGLKLAFELIGAISVVLTDLQSHNVSYAQPSNAQILTNNLDFSSSCGAPSVTEASQFFCWVGNEHSGNTYLTLLGGTPTNIKNDPNCPAFTPPSGGGTDNAFAQAQIAAWKQHNGM